MLRSMFDVVAVLINYLEPNQGPALFYVDSDGTRLRGDLFSVGSGSTFAYGVLDQGYSWDLSDEDAQELGRRSIYAAAHRDAFSGNTINVYHVKEDGWERFDTVDVNELVRHTCSFSAVFRAISSWRCSQVSDFLFYITALRSSLWIRGENEA